MPEHRDGTPPELRTLESFLWHDLGEGPASWAAWLKHRDLRAISAASTASSAALRLHAALRTLQAANADPDSSSQGGGSARAVLNGLTEQFRVRPVVHTDGSVSLTSPDPGDPVALLLVEALEAMRSNCWRRFKLCRDEACHASFYDASKACGKVWCDMATCGSQHKMRRYRAKSGYR